MISGVSLSFTEAERAPLPRYHVRKQGRSRFWSILALLLFSCLCSVYLLIAYSQSTQSSIFSNSQARDMSSQDLSSGEQIEDEGPISHAKYPREKPKEPAQEELKNSGSAQDEKGKKSLIVGIVDEHNDVMQYWIVAYKNGTVDHPVPLLHIDSHSDAALPFHDHAFHTMEQQDLVDAKEVRNMTSIGDFIPVAQWMGILSGQVVWIQPDWPGEPFNFYPGKPHTGVLVKRKRENMKESKAGNVGAIERSDQRSYLCMAEVHNTRAESLDDIVGNQGLCYRKDDQDRQHEIHVRWDVLHATNTEKVARIIPRGTPYILDIDLDYFASMCPTLFSLIKPEEHNTLFKALEDTVGDHNMCYDNDPVKARAERKSLTAMLRAMFWKGLTFLPDTTEQDDPVFLRRLDTASVTPGTLFDKNVLNLWCNGREAAWSALIRVSKLVHLFSQQLDYLRFGLLRFDSKFPDASCKVNELFGTCQSEGDPTRLNPSRAEVRRSMIKLRDMLQATGPPRVVTVARSLDGYTPAHLFPFIERQLIEVLREAFHQDVEIIIDYLPGVPPAPPVIQDEKLAFEKSPLKFINNTQRESLHNELTTGYSGEFSTIDQWIAHDRWTSVKIRNILLLQEYLYLHGIDISDFLSSHHRNYRIWKRRRYARIKQREKDTLQFNEDTLRAAWEKMKRNLAAH